MGYGSLLSTVNKFQKNKNSFTAKMKNASSYLIPDYYYNKVCNLSLSSVGISDVSPTQSVILFQINII